ARPASTSEARRAAPLKGLGSAKSRSSPEGPQKGSRHRSTARSSGHLSVVKGCGSSGWGEPMLNVQLDRGEASADDLLPHVLSLKLGVEIGMGLVTSQYGSIL